MADIMGLLKSGCRGRWWFCTTVCYMFMAAAHGQASSPAQHQLHVVLQPEQHTLQVEDVITFDEGVISAGELRFSLHADLNPRVATPGVTLRRVATSFHGVPVETFAVSLPVGRRSFTLHYQGEIHHPLGAEGAAAVRGELSTAGSIGEDGIFLAGSTAWYPDFGVGLFTFQLEVDLPQGWLAVSQGRRIDQESAQRSRVTWVAEHPQQDVYLIAAPFTEYRQRAGEVMVEVFLRQPDAELAQRYLAATGPYLAMYQHLIGDYPYAKFALVENFWETGYGMPSFTLMGPRIIRFPFIIYSSYPHEILHNWWGNSVYVDYRQGNWSEGLTAYLSDHLLQEQRGKAVDYRRTTLQKYTDYVASSRDFPLTAFRGRHDGASEAIGYGKSMMFFHMLRRHLGDARFKTALRRFYRDNVFTEAGFSDIQRAVEASGAGGLGGWFEQWLTRTGAPQLAIAEAVAEHGDGQWFLDLVLEQRQSGEPYILNVPVAITMADATTAYQTTVAMSAKRQRFRIAVPAAPLRVDVDPQFDVFRRVDQSEVPPALSRIFGAERVLLVLPAHAPEALRAAYRELAETWRQPGVAMEIVLDDAIDELPGDRAVWVFGWDNRFRDRVAQALAPFGAEFRPQAVEVLGQPWRRDQSSLVLVAPNPVNDAHAMAWVGADNVAAVPGLARKLPHYGKYSYLAFTGEAPDNVLSGMWTPPDSVMAVAVTQPDASRPEVDAAPLPPETPLIASPQR